MYILKRMKMRTALSFISYVFIFCSILAAQSYCAADAALENGTLATAISNSDVTGKNFGDMQINPSPPTEPVRLIFIHHSTGENWLNDYNGALGLSLRDNNYFLSDTNYGWGPDSIGDHTDVGHWWLWFRGPDSNEYMNALYAESVQHCEYSRLPISPGGQNEIVMFKSCFPNSALLGNPSDPVPPIASNPLRGQDSGSEYHTVANAKGIYIDLLEYFSSHQEKLFIVITAPPLSNPEYSGNARAFNQWLINDWLNGYPYSNVFVFDFYNVLTTNGGSPSVNDLGWTTGHHHRLWDGAIQHSFDGNPSHNVLAYPTGDDHPGRAGNLKATGEFVTLLNVAYHRWIESHSVLPTVNNVLANGIGNTIATVGAQITNTGNANPELHICWGTSDAGTNPSSWQHNENLGVQGVGTYYRDLSSLTPATMYYYRCYVTNSAGTGWASSTATFTTNTPPVTGWNPLGGYITSSPSVIIDNQGKTEVWVKGGDNALWVNIDGSWQGKGGFLTSDPFTVKDCNGKIHVLVRGGDNGVWDFIYDSTTSSGHWKNLGGYITNGLTAAIDPANCNILRVAVIGGDNALWTCEFDINTETFAWTSQGGFLTSRPYILFDPSGKEHIFVRGGDNALWDKKGVWSESAYTRTWIYLGGILANGPVATIEPGVNAHVVVIVKGSDNAIWICDVDSASEPEIGSWYGLGGVITSDPDAIADTSANKIHVFVRGGNSALWENIFSTNPWNPNGNQWQSMGGAILTYASGATIGSNTQAFVVGTDHALWRNTHATFSASSSEESSIQKPDGLQ
jgi:hypothetical protein